MTTFILTHKSRKVSPIAILVSAFGKKYRKNIGESIEVRQWNDRRKRAKVTSSNTEDSLLNERLEMWELAAAKAVDYFKRAGEIPQEKDFISKLQSLRFGEQSLTTKYSIKDYIAKTTPSMEGIYSKNRIKQYKLAMNVFDRFEKETGTDCTFHGMDSRMFEALKRWFMKNGYSENYFSSIIKIAKALARKAMREGVQVSGAFTDGSLSAPQKETDSIYLTEEELQRIARLGITEEAIKKAMPDSVDGHLPRRVSAYGKARDMFIIGAYTGLRYSDVEALKPENIHGGMITISTKKTSTRTVIPMHPIVSEILERYDFEPLPEQKLNKYMKIISKMAGINEKIVIVKKKVGGETKVIREKWELVSSHTARRSFATNAYKAGVPTLAIMKITGHRKESTFMKYIKVTEDENAEILQNHPFFSAKPVEPKSLTK